MKKNLLRNTILTAVVIVIGLAVMRAVRHGSGTGPQANQVVLQPALVQTTVVRAGTIEETLVLTGDLRPHASVEVKPKISGRLSRLALDDGTAVTEGTNVQQGQVIAVLEDKELQAQVSQARAAVETARAAVKAAEVNLEDAQREKTRMEALFEQGSATEQQRDRASAAYDRAAAGSAQAQAQLAQAQAALELAQVTLSEAFIRSPFTGVVTAKYVDPGAMISPAGPIVQVQAIDQLKCLVAVPAEVLPKVGPKRTPVQIHVEAYPQRTFEASILKVHPAVDPATRTATVELLLSNPHDDQGRYMLRPGMYATARIVLSSKDHAIVVPQDALIRSADRYYAYVAEGDVAHIRQVRLGIRSGRFVEVLDGIAQGEELVTGGLHRLIDGSRIERVEGQAIGGQVE